MIRNIILKIGRLIGRACESNAPPCMGDMAQLQGYVAEQMIAQELTAAGYDVEFPETSNQAGWDLLVDGEPFQVKCGASKQIVETHFEKYPDIPVYVNAELGHYYEGNPLVLTTSVTREQVLADTKQTLQHAGDLLDFEIPWITAGVSAFSNVKRMRKEQLLVSTAVRNVVADTASRTALAAAGQAVIGTAGAVLLPGAGAIVFPVVGAYIGMAQGGKVSNFIKKQFAHTEHEQLCLALHELIAKMQKVLTTKGTIKESKWQQIQSTMPSQVNASFAHFHDERMTLLENVKKELSAIDKIIDDNPLEAFEQIVSVLGKAGIHVYALKDELHGVEKAMVGYQRKL